MITFARKKEEFTKPEVNIGLVGHVDHGKTTLTHALSGKWTDTHSEEQKRGITIRLGYADATFYFCEKCKTYSATSKCVKCFGNCTPKRSVSFVDAPGHETLMATVLSGAALMDGAILLIAANEKCPQPQTAEHLKVLDISGIKKIVIAQNKIDIVSEKGALENYKQIKAFVKGSVAENAPVIPISASHNTNIDMLIQAIEEVITTPERDLTKDPKFFVARSFDINKPGAISSDLKGGVIGGSMIQGMLKVGDTIEIKPGAKIKEKWEPLTTKIVSIMQASAHIEEATPGGLLALQTELDTSLTGSDSLAGSIAGITGKLPPVSDEINIKVELFDYVIGIDGNLKIDKINTNDALMLTVTIAKTVGIVLSYHNNVCKIKLKLPVCTEKGDTVSISKQVGGRWHLIGYGRIQ